MNTPDELTCEQQVLHLLAQHHNYNTQILVAAYPTVGEHTLQQLVDTYYTPQLKIRNIDILKAVANNPNCDEQTLTRLGTQLLLYKTGVGQALAKNPAATTELLNKLAQTGITDVIAAVAAHLNTSEKTRTNLLKNANIEVLTLLAETTQLEPKYQTKLLNERPWIGEDLYVAQNPTCDPNTLAVLAKTGEDYVRLAVANNLNSDKQTLNLLAADGLEEIRAAVAANPNTPADTLRWLAKHYDSYETYIEIAHNPNSDKETLTYLLDQSDFDVAVAVAQNPNTPIRLLLQLVQTGEAELLEAAALNLNPDVELTAVRTQYLNEKYLDASETVEVYALLAQTADELINNPKTTDNTTKLQLYIQTLLNVKKLPDNTENQIVQTLLQTTWQHSTNLFTTAQKLTLQKQATDNNWDLLNKTGTTKPTLSVKKPAKTPRITIR